MPRRCPALAPCFLSPTTTATPTHTPLPNTPRIHPPHPKSLHLLAVFAVYLYYEYRPGSGSDKPLCKKPLYDLCFGIGILGLMGWPIAAINKIPCVARGFRCGKTESGEPRGIFTSCGMMYPFQLAHCVALVLWLIIGIPWLMGIGEC